MSKLKIGNEYIVVCGKYNPYTIVSVSEDGSKVSTVDKYGDDYCFPIEINSFIPYEKAMELISLKASKVGDTLKEATSIITTSRQKEYGTPEECFRLIAELWNEYLVNRAVLYVKDETGVGIKCSMGELIGSDVAQMMVLLKAVRMIAGSFKSDTFVDLAGYADLAVALKGENNES